MLVTLTQLVYCAPRKRMLEGSTPTGAALCSNRARGAHGRALTAGGAICCFAACVDGCLAAALQARVLGRSAFQIVTSHGARSHLQPLSKHHWAICPLIKDKLSQRAQPPGTIC